jgi:catechol 2,3-dioxygenase-like lactoylglutathione lyase family enzyme
MQNLEYNIAHFGIKVSNLENSIDFYKNNFGFEEIKKSDKPDLELKLASLQLEGSYLELIQPYYPKMRVVFRSGLSVKELLQKSTSHIALNVNDLSSAYKKLKENNAELTEFNEKFFFCLDPDGFLIEIRQR